MTDPRGVEVRVRPTPGGPQIHLDGVPVPPRMYFGNRLSGAVDLTAEWADYSFDVLPQLDVEGNGTFHFRFGHQPGWVELAELTITDAETGAAVLAPGTLASEAAFAEGWNAWPPDERNTVGTFRVDDGTLRVEVREPPDGQWPDFHLYCDVDLSFTAGRTYRVAFRARGNEPRRLLVGLYRVAGGEFTALRLALGPYLPQIRLAHEAGVRFVSFPMPNGWSPPGGPQDWAAVDAACREVIAVHPDVLLLPRIGLSAPPWWLDEHPEARMQYHDGSRNGLASVSDRAYRAAACAHLEALCAHLTAAFPEHFAGIHPCGQNTGEWFYEGTWEPLLSGYDPSTAAAWRAHLAARGLPDAPVPSADERLAHDRGLLRDPVAEAVLIEFNRFLQREMAGFVAEMAVAARRGTSGRKLVIFFYGYHYEFGAVPTGAPVCGHYGLEGILDDSEVDIFCSPISYLDRGWQGASGCMAPAESITAADKLWLYEDDTRTYLSGTTDFGGIGLPGRVEGLRATQAVLLRNTAQAALRGYGTWWMDLPGEGWFNDPELWAELVRMRPLDGLMLRRQAPYSPPIAIITHEDSICHLAGRSSGLAAPLINASRMAFGRCGAPYGQYLLRDAAAGTIPARLQVMLTAWALSPAERLALRGHRNGAARVWCAAPGYLTPAGFDPAAMREVSAFTHRLIEPGSLVVTPTPVGEALGLIEPWGPAEPIAPLFTCDAAEVETLARYADGSPAVAARAGGEGLDIYCGTPSLTSALVRAWARLAGVSLFCEQDVGLWESEGVLSLHTMSAGPLHLHTGVAQPVFDLLTNESVNLGPDLTMLVEAGRTMVLRYR